MTAFSYQHHFHPFLIDSSSNTMTLPTQTNIYNSNKMFGFHFEQPISNNTLQPYFSSHDQFYNPQGVDVVVDPLGVEVSTSVNNSCTTTTTATTTTTTTTSSCSNNKSSSGEEQITTTTTTTINPMDHNKRKRNYDATSYAAQSMESREVVAAVVKGKKPRKMMNTTSNKSSVEEMKKRRMHDKKEEDNNKSNKNKKKLKNIKAVAQSNEEKEEEATPSGYVHIRARRGQATDSHSLAERVRREKISERMKLLQALVPGCEKVTGKALMLEEIINYVQSLQNQVEFLSMKLASLQASFNPMFYDFGVDMEALMIKSEQVDVQECRRNQFTTNAFIATPNNNYPLPDSLTLLQQGQMPSILPQSNGQLLWDTDEVQKQRITSQSSGFAINNLPCFH